MEPFCWPTPAFYVGVRYTKLGLSFCMASTLLSEPTLVSDFPAVFRTSMRGLRDASVGNEQARAPESEPYLSAVAVLLWQDGQYPELSVTWSSLADTVESIRDHVSSKVRGEDQYPRLSSDAHVVPSHNSPAIHTQVKTNQQSVLWVFSQGSCVRPS